jgi:hypothetical protein
VRQASKIRFESCGYLLQFKGAGSMVQNGSEEIKRKRRITSTLYRQMELGFSMQHLIQFDFDIKVVSTIDNSYYAMMHKHWFKNLWVAATKQKFTDVEIFLGSVNMMESHRVILSDRSPVLNETLSKISNTAGKFIVTFGVEFDENVVYCFLNFLYTGRLEWSPEWNAKVMQLSKLAAMYEVETLKNISQPLNASPPDAEQVTNFLLEL